MGFSVDIFCSPPDDNFICSICTEVFKEPVVLSCDHMFCRECISAWFQTHSLCPIDRRQISSEEKRNLKQANRVVVNVIGGLKVKCQYRPNGCREVLSLETMDTHVAVCPYNPTRGESQALSASEILDVIHEVHGSTATEIRRINEELEGLKTALNQIQESFGREVHRLRNTVQQHVTTCNSRSQSAAGSTAGGSPTRKVPMMKNLVSDLLRDGYIKSRRVEKIMKEVDRANYCEIDPYVDKDVTVSYSPFTYIRAPHQHAIILELLNDCLKPGAKVLEIGCGTGYLTVCISLMVGQTGCVYGLDNNERYVQKCIANITRSNPTLIQSKTTQIFCKKYNNLDYQDQYFDVVHCDNVFSDIKYDDKLRFLKKGGTMITIDGYDHIYCYNKRENGSVDTTLIELEPRLACPKA